MNIDLKTGSRINDDNGDTLLHAAIELEVETTPGREKPPIYIALALDTSSSMHGEKLQYAKMAAENFIRWMNRRDRFALITYSTEAKTAVATQLLTDKESVVHDLVQLTAGGGTNLSAGYLEAVRQLVQVKEEGSIRRVILLTDGQANEGITDAQRLEKLAHRYHAQGISLSCIGCGDDFDGPLLERLAAAGMGNFHVVAHAEEVPNVFFREFGDIAGLAVQNARAELAFSPETSVEESFAQFNPTGNHGYAWAIGDMMVEKRYRMPLVLRLARDAKPIAFKISYFDLDKEDFMAQEVALTVAAAAPDEDVSAVDAEICLARAEKIFAVAGASEDEAQAAELVGEALALLDANRALDVPRIGARAAEYRRFLESLTPDEASLTDTPAPRPALRPGFDFTPSGTIVTKTFPPGFQIDMQISRGIRDEIVRLMRTHGRHSLIVDLGNVHYIDSSGIGMLVTLLRHWQQEQCLLVLAAPVPTVRRIMELTKLDSFFKIFDSVGEAADYITRKAKGETV